VSDPVTGTGWDQWVLMAWAALFPIALIIGITVEVVSRIKRK
jgi:hypothetical protein